MVKRTDTIVALTTVALVGLALLALAATATIDEFAAWAWARHHNVLSWYIRVLFPLPFCYFAYRRSLAGIVLTLVALATSMFWFPAPRAAGPARARVPGDGAGVPHRRVDAREGPPRPARADQPHGVGARLLEAVDRGGPSPDQRDRADQARLELLLRRRVGRPDPAALPARRPVDLQRGGAVGQAQDPWARA